MLVGLLAACGPNARWHPAEPIVSSNHSLDAQVTALMADRARLESLGTLARGRGHPDAAREIMSKILTLIP